jgi:hypothetical protein
VSQRPLRAATTEQLANGVPLFLDQLIKTLEAEDGGEMVLSLQISGSAGGCSSASEISVGATAHGKQLLDLGFTVDQVVHDYGDLCQAITDLAVERDAPFAVDQFRTLNRCLDNAIADAGTAFSLQRDAVVAQHNTDESNARLVQLVHKLRNSSNSANLALTALESGQPASLAPRVAPYGVHDHALSQSPLAQQGFIDLALAAGDAAIGGYHGRGQAAHQQAQGAIVHQVLQGEQARPITRAQPLRPGQRTADFLQRRFGPAQEVVPADAQSLVGAQALEFRHFTRVHLAIGRNDDGQQRGRGIGGRGSGGRGDGG